MCRPLASCLASPQAGFVTCAAVRSGFESILISLIWPYCSRVVVQNLYDYIGVCMWKCAFKTLKAWYRMDSNAPWRLNRPGECPYKPEGNVFTIVPGGGLPTSIYPDAVHTFHIGFGADMCASMIIWLARMGKFGVYRSFDERLRSAFSAFQQYCHDTNRFNSCHEWCLKKFGMSQLPSLACNFFWGSLCCLFSRFMCVCVSLSVQSKDKCLPCLLGR